MMRIFLCRDCKRWQYISDRLQGQCNRCDRQLMGTDIPFEDFVDLDERQREELIAFAESCIEQQASEEHMKKGSGKKEQSLNRHLRQKVSSYLNREVHSNRELPEDTGYDY